MSSRSRSTAASACCATRLSPRHEGDPAAPPRRPGGARICRGADPGSRRGQGARQGRHDWRQHAGSAGAPRHLCLDAAPAPTPAGRALAQPFFVSARDLPVRAGCYAEYIAVPARAAHPLPPGCALEAAACLSNYQVAYHVLHTAARGVEAKRVLVHTAAGGVGSAAVQLALIAGLEVIGVAGSEKKTRAILGLSAQHAIDYRSEDVVARVRELTGGRGADLILDPIGGKGFGRNFDMLAPLGMVVSYGRLDGPPDADLLTAMRANSAKSPAVRFFTIHSFDDRPDIRAAAMTVLLDHLAAARIRPLIHDRLPLAEAGRAQALLESGQVIGKLPLKP